LRIYETYLERALLSDDNPLQSNGYTFMNLYPFLSKYNAFFQRFVEQLLAATIILRRGGLLIRNSIFTKQKHWYKRGVNVANGTTGYDMRGNLLVQYFGDDGSKFQIIQTIPPPPPPPTPLYVETIPGVIGSLITGGQNIVGYDELTEYGIDYKLINYPYPYGGESEPIGLLNLLEGIDYELESLDNNWTRISEVGPLTVNNFTMTLTGLLDDSDYQYRAFVKSLSTGATGNTLSIHTPPPPPQPPSIETKVPLGETTNSITSTGGVNISQYQNVQYYAMQYREKGNSTWILQPTPPLTGPLSVNNFTRGIVGLQPQKTYEFRAYMIVNGTTYYGNILEATTDPLPLIPFTVTTDVSPSHNPNGTSFTVDDNSYVISSGQPPNVLEFGILYTQNAIQGTAANLIYTNPLVGIDKHNGTPLYAPIFYGSASNLNAGTTTYYRAFIKNGAGVGYGNVETTTTPSPTIFIGFGDVDIDIASQQFCGYAKIVPSQPILINDSFRLNFTNKSHSETLTPQPYTISAVARMICNGVNCCYTTTEINPPINDVEEDVLSGYICVSGSNINKITACVCAYSNYANDTTKIKNYGEITLTSISDINNPSGKNYQLSGNLKLCVDNTTTEI